MDPLVTNNASLIQDTQVIPGISDHDIRSLLTSHVSPQEAGHKKRRPILGKEQMFM